MGYKNNNRGGTAFDAATASSMAFLNSQLELPDMEIVKPMTSVTHKRDISIKFGGGYPQFLSAYATNYATTGGNEYGLQGTNNTEIPLTQVSISKGLWQAWIWSGGFSISHADLERLKTAKAIGYPPPFSLQEMLEEGVSLTWEKAMDKVTYTGWEGQPGLVNNPNITSSLAPNPGGGTTWATKTPTQIQADINFMLLQTVTNSVYSLEGMADTILIPWSVNNALLQPMTTGGFSSILEFVLHNNIAKQNGIDLKIFPLPNDWIGTAGVGGVTRAVAYRNNEKTVKLRVPVAPQKVLTMPTTRNGVSYETVYQACIGQVEFRRNQPFYYLDGV